MTKSRQVYALGITLALFASSAGWAAERPRYFSLGIGAAESPETTFSAFYEGVRDQQLALNEFGGDPALRYNFFGQKDSRCYEVNTPEHDRKLVEHKLALLREPSECTQAKFIIEHSFGLTGDKKVKICQEQGDLDGDGKSDLTGYPAGKFYVEPLQRIIAQASAGDRLLITLNGHGWKLRLKLPAWYVEMGDRMPLYADELKPFLQELKRKGVSVNYNVVACFSGGFNLELSDGSADDAQICGTAIADADLLGYSGDATYPTAYDLTYGKNFREKGSQLAAFACSMAQDTVNHPNSSLDAEVARWADYLPEGVLDSYQPVKSLDQLDAAVESVLQDLSPSDGLYAYRRELIGIYREYFLGPFRSCAIDRSVDARFREILLGCSLKSGANVPRELMDLHLQVIQEKSGDAHSVKVINRELHFLKSAEGFRLRRFRNLLCCLGFDFKTGKSPAFCSKH